MAQARASAVVGRPGVVTGRVVPLRAPRPILAADTDHCPKCESGYVTREPAFLHCHFCGNMAPIARGSLMDQELYERRSGLRIAS